MLWDGGKQLLSGGEEGVGHLVSPWWGDVGGRVMNPSVLGLAPWEVTHVCVLAALPESALAFAVEEAADLFPLKEGWFPLWSGLSWSLALAVSWVLRGSLLVRGWDNRGLDLERAVPEDWGVGSPVETELSLKGSVLVIII